MIVFLHICKTGGTSLRRYYDKKYPGSTFELLPRKGNLRACVQLFASLSVKRQFEIKAAYGHCYYGIHNYLRPKARYVTILREPVVRTISQYNHCLTVWRKQDSPRYRQVKAASFDQWVQSSYEGCNKMTRFIFGKHHQQLSMLHVEKAMLYLRSFLRVYFTDELDWLPKRDFVPERITHVEPGVYRTEVTRKMRQQAVKANALDIELYKLAKQEFGT